MTDNLTLLVELEQPALLSDDDYPHELCTPSITPDPSSIAAADDHAAVAGEQRERQCQHVDAHHLFNHKVGQRHRPRHVQWLQARAHSQDLLLVHARLEQ